MRVSQGFAFWIWVLSGVSGGVAWASTGSCTTPMALANYGSTSTANGCYDIDQTFSNFAVANQSTVGATIQSLSTVDVSGSSTWTSDASPWMNTSTFSGNTGANSNTPAPWTITANDVNLGGTITYLTNTTEAYFSPSSYLAPPAGDSLLITNVSLSEAGLTGADSSDSATVTETLCVGSATCSQSGSNGNAIYLVATISGANQTIPQYQCFYASTSANAGATCSTVFVGPGGPSSPITVTFTNPVATLNFTDQYELVAADGVTSTVTLDDLSNTFGNEEVSPEPSTFVLLGAGLAGLGLMRAHRRRAEQNRDREGADRSP
jgi:hypothetical protein